MKVCLAQTAPVKGDIDKNIEDHSEKVAQAIEQGCDCIIFPELSLTGYEPSLAKELAMDPYDRKLDPFQTLSEKAGITIGLGVPTRSNSGILITMIIFRPVQARQTYSKQFLHPDEFPFFSPGDKTLIIPGNDEQVAPAICYESLLPDHAEKVHLNGASLYFSSVAKSETGLSKAFAHYPNIAAKYSMTVCMANSVGPCDNFISAGSSSVWNKKGIHIVSLNKTEPGIVVYDTNTGESIVMYSK